MGCFPTELNLNLRTTFVPKTITDFLSHLSTVSSTTHNLSTLDDLVARLETELTKIHAFKRELPLCILLLNEAISALKVESEKCRVHKSEPVLKEFIPLKRECDQKDHESKDKKNWMSSVQLWNTTTSNSNNNSYSDYSKQNYKLEIKKKNEEERTCRGRDFVMPFYTYFATKEEKEDSDINGISLKTPGMRNSSEGSDSYGSRTSFSKVVSFSPQMKTARKQRRSWSPELHRRFVEALEELGGSQAATPKQIRALMRVDGLTNDEVKSHLQKYRLYRRRVPPAPAATTNQYVIVHRGLLMNNGSGSQGLTTRSREGAFTTKGGNMEDVKPEI